MLAFLGTECPLVKLYGPKLQRLSDSLDGRGVAFLGVNSNRQDSLTDISVFARRHGVTFPILKDGGRKLADMVKAERTPEVVVLDQNRRIVYRGRIDNQYGVNSRGSYAREKSTENWLVKGIEAALEGTTPETMHVPAQGCLIARARPVQADSEVTFGGQIADILNRNCVNCHRDGEIAPFALQDYDEVAGWADMIREVVQDNRMPPWHADPAHGDFANARGLTAEEKGLINQWVLAGAPPGDLTSVPSPPPKADGWQLDAEPDLVVSMGTTFEVPAEGEVRYKYFKVNPEFKENRWVRAAEVVPGSRDVVHHILVFARDPSQKDAPLGAGGGSFLAAYVPGLRAAEYPAGMAKLVRAGSELVFQMHYTPNGRVRTDESSIGLYFMDEDEVREVVVTQEVRNGRFEIPPGASDFPVEAKSPRAQTGVKLLSMMPHMHLRGKSFRYDAILPGRTETLLNVPAYDFNWQTSYRLKQPLAVPSGTQLYCKATFDNSSDNPNNPDPSAVVKWGDQTDDEMMLGYYDIAVPRKTKSAPTSETDRLIRRFDASGDGLIQKDEVPPKLRGVFERLDVDRSGDLTRKELDQLQLQRR